MRRIIFGFTLVGTLAACGDPLSDVATINDVGEVANQAPVAEASSEADRSGGLFGRLLDRQADDPTNAAVEAALLDVADVDVTPTVRIVDQNALDPTEVAATVSETPRRGLAGLFRRNNENPGPAPRRPRTGPDAIDVEPGIELPFGGIARVCGLNTADLGTLVDQGSGFQIYDTDPDSTVLRSFYITGFGDNCARTFTGAVMVSGDVQTHEFVRYQGSNEQIGYTSTDNAYEALKANVCRVGRGQPCGERTERLNQNTRFITVYDFFGGTFNAVPRKWAQILLHDSEVLAMSLKDGQ